MIVRSLIAGVPLRIIAATTDTSTTMIERTYSAYVGHYADEIARRGLLARFSHARRGRDAQAAPEVMVSMEVDRAR